MIRPTTHTASNRVHLILQSPYQEDLDRVRTDFFKSSPGSSSQVVADLPLVDALAVQVEREHLSGFLRVIGSCRDMNLVQDKKVRITDNGDTHGRPDPVAVPSTRAPELWGEGLTGKGVGIAVLDTGLTTHPELQGRISHFKDLVNGRLEAYDDHGHGTHVSSLAAGSQAGTAPEAHVVGIKVLDETGEGRFSDVIKGIQWAVENREEHNIKVLNLSLGGKADLPYREDPVAQALDAAREKGILAVVAAGNDGPFTRSILTPAHAEHVLTVGASNTVQTVTLDDDRVGSFSSRGPTRTDGLIKPDVIAPGVRISAADGDGNGYISRSGTSMATPLVAGIAAQLLEAHPAASPEQLKQALMEGAHLLQGAGDATVQGQGVVDAVEALAHLDSLRKGD